MEEAQARVYAAVYEANRKVVDTLNRMTHDECMKRAQEAVVSFTRSVEKANGA